MNNKPAEGEEGADVELEDEPEEQPVERVRPAQPVETRPAEQPKKGGIGGFFKRLFGRD